MATEIFTDDVLIQGSEDEVQLSVQGTSGQTAPLQTWENASADIQAQVSADGRFQTGDMGMSTPDALIEAHRDSGSSLPKRGFHSLGKIASALSNAVAWLVGELELLGSGDISGLHRLFRATLTHSSTGDSSAAELRAGEFELINQSGDSFYPLGKAVVLEVDLDNQSAAYLDEAIGIRTRLQNGASAEINIAKGIEVQVPVNTGTISTLIGIDVADMDEGTDNYALRTGAGKVQLGELGAGLVKSDATGLLENAVAGTDYDIPMQGASDTLDGEAGIAPQPMAGDENKFLRGDGSWADASLVAALDDLSDVDTTGASTDDVLTFDGSDWVAQAPTMGGGLPAGMFVPFAGISAPTGWLLCDGLAVSRTTYATLYSVVNELYKRFASLNSRSSDSAGSIDFGDSNHGLSIGAATLTLRFSLSATISAVATGTEIITTSAAHMFDTGDRVHVSSTGNLPGGLSASTDYYVRVVSATQLTLHPSLIDAQNDTNKINLTSAGSGTRTLTMQDEAVRSGMSITAVSGSVIDISGGSGHSLPAVAANVTVDCDSSLFFLPDMRGRVALGAGLGSGLVERILGTQIGEEAHQLSTSEMPSHSHTERYLNTSGGTTGIQAYFNGNSGAVANSGITTASTGGGQAHNNMQPSLVANYIIKI